MTKQEYIDMYEVVGAAMEVHSVLGHGMAEAIYQEALAVEMKKRGMEVLGCITTCPISSYSSSS